MSFSQGIARAVPQDTDLDRLQTLYDDARYGEVLQQIGPVIIRHPDRADLYAMAASSAHRLGALGHAEMLYAQAVEIDGPGSVFVRHLGRVLLDHNRPEMALEQFRQRIKAVPKDAEAWHGAGSALVALTEFAKAVTFLAEALRLDASNARYAHSLGQTYEQMGLFRDAGDCHALAMGLDPDWPAYPVAFARALHSAGRSETALDALDSAAERWPDNGPLHDTRGNVLAALGQFDQAKDSYRTAIAAQPDSAAPYVNFARFADMRDEPELATEVDRLLSSSTDPKTRSWLLFTKTKILEDHGDIAAAYDTLCAANDLQKQILRYDLAKDRALFAEVKAAFADPPDPLDVDLDGAPAPVFILGLPRSGSTLSETILAGHGQITACGELDALSHAVRQGGLTRLDETALRSVRAAYFKGVPELSGLTRLFTDKMPLNFRLIGHIATCLPEAKIVHITRDPRATCWSMFRNYFSGSGNGFAYDPSDIVGYHHLYLDLMAFWRDRFGERMIDLSYEDLVCDRAMVTRTLLTDLGLEWDDGCLHPERAGRSVRTASVLQVRQKVQPSGAEGWRKYAPFAADWLDQLEPVAQAEP